MEIIGALPERHVAVFAFPFASHPSIILSLVKRLSSASPTVVFSFFNSVKSNRDLFSELNRDNIRPYDVSNGIPEDSVFVGKPQEDINLFLGVAEEEFRRVVKVAEEDIGLRISCLVVDAFLWFSSNIAEDMNIPWIAFSPIGACSLSTHFYTDFIREKTADQFKGSGSADPQNEIVDFIPGFSKVRLGDLPSGILFGDLKSPFSAMLHKMGRTLAKSTAVAISSFQELDPDITIDLSSKFNHYLNIGPFHLTSKQKPQSKFDEISRWLESQKPRSVAYISFGTVCKLLPEEIVSLAETLEETKTPFLWSLKNDSMKHFPHGFLERISSNGKGKVVPWAPQVQVLEHLAVGVFVTHGGWNSVLESLGAGVPMICRPFFGDHQINTWMIERIWGIGMRIEGGNFTKHGTRSALEQIFSICEASEKRKVRSEVVKELAHKAVEPNGSSSRNFKTLVDLVTNATL